MRLSALRLLFALAPALLGTACAQDRSCLDDSACPSSQLCVARVCAAPLPCNSDDDCPGSHPRCRVGACISSGPSEVLTVDDGTTVPAGNESAEDTSEDKGGEPQAAEIDPAIDDGGTVDFDAGADDAGADDAGPTDAAVSDAGLVDAGSVDAGSVDAGSVDAGSVDAGPVDAGPVDAGGCTSLVSLSMLIGEAPLPFPLVSGQGLAGLYVRPDGTAAYVCETLYDRCSTLQFAEAWDVTSVVNLDEGPTLGDSYPADVFFRPDGTRLFLLGSGADRLYQFDLDVPWDISTAQAAGSAAFPLETASRAVFFRPDGTRVYLRGLASDQLFQYDLVEAWDVASLNGASPNGVFSVVPYMLNPGISDFHLDETGTELHWSREGEAVYQVTLTTPWDVTSASAPISIFLESWMQGASPRGIWLTADGLYVIDPEGARLRQYARACE